MFGTKFQSLTANQEALIRIPSNDNLASANIEWNTKNSHLWVLILSPLFQLGREHQI